MLGMGFNFIYLEKGYYVFLEKFLIYVYNLLAWMGLCIIMIVLGVTVIRTKKLRHEFKHSKTLFKKWTFNIVELLYLPVLVNTIPMLTCSHKTIKNGYELHKCNRYGAQYIFYIVGIVMIVVAFLYNIGLIYMIRKRKITYRKMDHNSFLIRKELEYILEISDSWRKQSFFLFSSFKGSKLRMYFRPCYNIYLLFLV